MPLINWLPIILGLAVLYIPSLYDLFTGIWSQDEQMHGPIVLGISVWLLYRNWGAMEAAAQGRQTNNWGWPIFVFGLLLYALGRSQDILLFEIGSVIWLLTALIRLPVASKIIPGQMARIDTPALPTEATREALANAFIHRDYTSAAGSVGVALYDDRLEVISSGGLHFGLTPAMLFKPHESNPWNPWIANVFYRRGYIESWGRGTLMVARKNKSLMPDVALLARRLQDGGVTLVGSVLNDA